ncbi:MAG: FAD-dependent monooxygenase [Acidobacteriaceae bacterium]|nr:FAD-dependent monooxygenase [Acidobacteriaceae bacterium]
MFDTDIFVLGGGPAGLAAAIAARRSGFRVTLADASEPPIDKACGEGLMPDALHAAAALGIDIPETAGYAFKGIGFQNQLHHVTADFPNGTGLGVRRMALQRLLAENAARTGVELIWRTPVTGIERGIVSLGTKRMRSRWIVGADGSQSSVRRWAGLGDYKRNSLRFSYRRHYGVEPWSEYVEIFWGEGFELYVTPVSAKEVCVVLMTRNHHRRVSDALPDCPQLQAHLRGAPAVSTERGAYAAMRRLHRVTRGCVALVGDASGDIDPITGEGLCLAFRQAGALAKALKAEDLCLYESAHRRLSRRPRWMADFMLLMDRSTFVQRRVMRAFAAHPRLFASMLAMHVGQSSPIQFAATTAALGWRMAAR